MRRMHDVVGEACFQRRAWQLDQLASLQVRRGDVPARERYAQAVHGREHCIGRVGERMGRRQIRSTHVGCAKPVRPALQTDVRDQRQAENVSGLRHLPDPGQRRRRNREQCVVHQVVRSETRPWPGSVPDAEIRTAVVEARQRSRRLQVELHVRMCCGKAGQARDEPAIGERMQRRYPNSGNFLVVAQQRAGYCVEVGQRDVGRIGQRAALGRQRVPRAQLERGRSRRTVGERLRVVATDDNRCLDVADGPSVIEAEGNGELGPQRGDSDRCRRAAATETGAHGARLLFRCMASDVMNRVRRRALVDACRLRDVRRVTAVHGTRVCTSRLHERGGEPQSPDCDEEAIPERMSHGGIILLLLV